jgi:hypothetical protein
MGVTTSKVRSVQLDHIHPYVQDMLKLMTNSAANGLLLVLPRQVEIGPRTELAARKSFIMRKSQQLEWAVKIEPQDPFDAITQFDFLALFHAMNFGRAEERCDSLTILHAAVQSGDPLLVTIAACCQPEIDAVDSNGWTALCYALFLRLNEISRFLIGLGAIPEKAQMDVGLLAMCNGDYRLLDAVVFASREDPRALELTPASLRFASRAQARVAKIVVPHSTRQAYAQYRRTVLS